MYITRFWILVLLAAAIAAGPRATAGQISGMDAREIVRKVDELYRSFSSYCEVEMEIVTP